jgi:hypothetical protein
MYSDLQAMRRGWAMVWPHPILGGLPLVVTNTGLWMIDPAFRLIDGLLAANPSQQWFGLARPIAIYHDQRRICQQCELEFLFSAVMQQHWYEKLCFINESIPQYCPQCRQERRIAVNIGRISQQLQHQANDPQLWLALTRARMLLLLVQYSEQRCNNVIAAARKAYQLDQTLIEVWYWEALAQEQADRVVRAEVLYWKFLFWHNEIGPDQFLDSVVQKIAEVLAKNIDGILED